MLSDKVIRSEQLAAQVAQAGQTPPLAFGAEPPPLLGSPGAGGPSVSRREDSVGSGSGATAAAAGGAGPGAGPSAAGPASRLAPVPPPLAEAFRQVRHAVHTESSAWRLRAVLGSARVLEHTHGGGLAPLCAHKAVVQVDAPPRSVRNIVLELRVRRTRGAARRGVRDVQRGVQRDARAHSAHPRRPVPGRPAARHPPRRAARALGPCRRFGGSGT